MEQAPHLPPELPKAVVTAQEPTWILKTGPTIWVCVSVEAMCEF